MATEKAQSVKEGVEAAWDFWLSQHDVSVPEIVGESIEKAFAAWLNAHEDEIIEAIVKQAASR